PQTRGATFGAPKKDAQSEWTCGLVDGRQALGMTGLSGATPAQIVIDLEKSDGLGYKLEPGQRLRLRMTYRRAGKGAGAMSVQAAGDAKELATPLPNSNAEWQTVEVVATRAEKPLRCVVETTEGGAGNTLFVRTITVTDLGKPAPSAADLSKWTEGPVVYSLDVSKIPPFWVKTGEFTCTSGEPGRRPAGRGARRAAA